MVFYESLDKCVKEVVVMVIIVVIRLLERVIGRYGYDVIVVWILVVDVLVFVKVFFERLYGVIVDMIDED